MNIRVLAAIVAVLVCLASAEELSRKPGTIFACGWNNGTNNRLGINSTAEIVASIDPVADVRISPIWQSNNMSKGVQTVAIEPGPTFLLSDGSVWIAGLDNGDRGLGQAMAGSNHTTPVRLQPSMMSMKHISCSFESTDDKNVHCVGVTITNDLVVFGDNRRHQLGFGTGETVPLPSVAIFGEVISASTTFNHTLACVVDPLTMRRVVVGMGTDNYGELRGDSHPYPTAIWDGGHDEDYGCTMVKALPYRSFVATRETESIYNLYAFGTNIGCAMGTGGSTTACAHQVFTAPVSVLPIEVRDGAEVNNIQGGIDTTLVSTVSDHLFISGTTHGMGGPPLDPVVSELTLVLDDVDLCAFHAGYYHLSLTVITDGAPSTIMIGDNSTSQLPCHPRHNTPGEFCFVNNRHSTFGSVIALGWATFLIPFPTFSLNIDTMAITMPETYPGQSSADMVFDGVPIALSPIHNGWFSGVPVTNDTFTAATHSITFSQGMRIAAMPVLLTEPVPLDIVQFSVTAFILEASGGLFWRGIKPTALTRQGCPPTLDISCPKFNMVYTDLPVIEASIGVDFQYCIAGAYGGKPLWQHNMLIGQFSCNVTSNTTAVPELAQEVTYSVLEIDYTVNDDGDDLITLKRGPQSTDVLWAAVMMGRLCPLGTTASDADCPMDTRFTIVSSTRFSEQIMIPRTAWTPSRPMVAMRVDMFGIDGPTTQVEVPLMPTITAVTRAPGTFYDWMVVKGAFLDVATREDIALVFFRDNAPSTAAPDLFAAVTVIEEHGQQTIKIDSDGQGVLKTSTSATGFDGDLYVTFCNITDEPRGPDGHIHWTVCARRRAGSMAPFKIRVNPFTSTIQLAQNFLKWAMVNVTTALGVVFILVGLPVSFVLLGAAFVAAVLVAVMYSKVRKERRLRRTAIIELAKLGVDGSNKLFSAIYDFYIPPDKITETETIAAGGFGSVSRAVYKNRIVCVKKLHDMLTSDPKSLEEFAREARALVDLRHPNVLNFLGATLRPPAIFIVTEFCAFGSLQQYVQNEIKQGTMTDADLLGLLADAGKGLAFVHSKGIIHRDIKPDNFFVSVEEKVRALRDKKPKITVKVGDLGLAVHSTNQTMTNVGTIGFAAPELLQRDDYTNKVDVFSFGMTVYALFVGRMPFEEEKSSFSAIKRIVSGDRPSLEGVPPEVAEVITKCWAEEPGARPTMKHAVRMLQAVAKTAAHDPVHHVMNPMSDSGYNMV